MDQWKYNQLLNQLLNFRGKYENKRDMLTYQLLQSFKVEETIRAQMRTADWLST